VAANPDIFATFKLALDELPSTFVVVLNGMVQTDLPEYTALCARAFAAGYEVQRHALEPFGEVGTAIMFVRTGRAIRVDRTPVRKPNGL
jgi:hypothetical protein